jgi:hypothetical protein
LVPALPACQMIFDVIGDLLADGREFKQLVLDNRIDRRPARRVSDR